MMVSFSWSVIKADVDILFTYTTLCGRLWQRPNEHLDFSAHFSSQTELQFH